jgi:3-hydroxyacyl-CoA dehydrogenase/enoyl-CoA hydratase/3-hydroxybutyryl-CoA epimerase
VNSPETSPKANTKYLHWVLRSAEGEKPKNDSIFELCLNAKGKSKNVLSSEVIEELGQILESLSTKPMQGLIITSGKINSFILGADIEEFQQIKTREQALEKVVFANTVLNLLEAFPTPTVAMLNGHCFGGGLELALACDYIVMSDSREFRIGLPEVKLGIHPGFGGTARLPQRIGILKAMDLILSGRAIPAETAARMNLVDYAVPPRQLMATAKFAIRSRPSRKSRIIVNQLTSFFPTRFLISIYLRKQVSEKINPLHYPAPFAVIQNYRNSGGCRRQMFEKEQESVSRLLISPTSRNLSRVFFLQERLKKIAKNPDQEKFSHVHVIGAGVMGADIAAWCSLKGLKVTIHDLDPEKLAVSMKRAYKLFKLKLRKPRLIQSALDRFHPDISGNGARTADVIIEAIFENRQAKQEVFLKLETIAKPNAILASNTSSITLESIAEAMKDPCRLVGLHFFNPVSRMQLVEIVSGAKTGTEIYSKASRFIDQIGRLPIQVKSSPGFLVNRVLMPYCLEAVELTNEGVKPEVIDQVAIDFGMPMGPITLADTVGLDICLHVAENLSHHFDIAIPDLIQHKVDKGHLGRKSGRGFYSWKNNKPVKKPGPTIETGCQIKDRLVLRYLNECVACLDDNIVAESDLLDAALVFGTGFAPFRGGPMNYILQHGAHEMHQKLIEINEKFGPRFRPAKGWEKLTKE